MATYIKTVDPNGGADYTSISAWEAGEQSLYTSGDIAIADCRRTGATKDTTPVTVDGWPAGVVPKIIVNPVYRHEGRWAEQRVSDGNYVYICEGGGSADVIAVNVQDAVVDGLAAVALQSPYGYRSIFRSGIATGIRFENIFGRCASTTTNTHGFSAEISGTTLINAIFWASVASAGTGVRFPYAPCHCYNVTSFGFNRGFEVGWGAADVVNCYGGGTTVASYQMSQLHANTNNNVSSDSTAPGTTKATGKTAYSDYFVDPANGDFHLKNTSDNLWGISGVDLSGVFTADIDGQTRSAPWDIGADQYVAAVGSVYTESLTSTVASVASIDDRQTYLEAASVLIQSGAALADVQTMLESVIAVASTVITAADFALMVEQCLAQIQASGSVSDALAYVENLVVAATASASLTDLQHSLETLLADAQAVGNVTDVAILVETLLTTVTADIRVEDTIEAPGSVAETLLVTATVAAEANVAQQYVEGITAVAQASGSLSDLQIFLDNLDIMSALSVSATDIAHYLDHVTVNAQAAVSVVDLIQGAFVGRYLFVDRLPPRNFIDRLPARSFIDTPRGRA